jgi:hypothetical protein
MMTIIIIIQRCFAGMTFYTFNKTQLDDSFQMDVLQFGILALIRAATRLRKKWSKKMVLGKLGAYWLP